MIKTIRIVPRVAVKELILDRTQSDISYCLGDSKSFSLISICGVKEDEERSLNTLIMEEESEILKSMGCVRVLTSYFMDVSKDQFDRMHNTIFMEGMLIDEKRALEIVSFINSIKDFCEHLLIHCDAGVSRSAAVGLFATRYLGLNEEDFFKLNQDIGPKRYVYDILCKVSGMDPKITGDEPFDNK